jgi:hypothetical protein
VSFIQKNNLEQIKLEKDIRDEKHAEVLGQKFEESIKTTTKKFKSLDIRTTYTVAGVSSLLSGLLVFTWAFPQVVSDNEVMSKIITFDNPLTVTIWIISLLLILGAYVLFKSRENMHNKFLSLLKSEANQNMLLLTYRDVKQFTNPNSNEFAKDQFTTFIKSLHPYPFTVHFPYDPDGRYWMEYISSCAYRNDEPKPKTLYRMFKKVYFAGLFSGTDTLDDELSQSLSDIIIERAERNGFIRRLESSYISEKYEYT